MRVERSKRLPPRSLSKQTLTSLNVAISNVADDINTSFNFVGIFIISSSKPADTVDALALLICK